MNNKNQKLIEALDTIKSFVKDGEISIKEVTAYLKSGSKEQKEESSNLLDTTKNVSIQQVFYLLGVIIIFSGFSIFIADYWGDWNPTTQTLFSFGISAFLFSAGNYLYKQKNEYHIFGFVFFLVSALLIPLGFSSLLYIFSPEFPNTDLFPTLIAGLSLPFYLALYAYYKNNLHLILSLTMFSSLYIYLTNFLVSEPGEKYFVYRIIFLGISYLFIAFYYNKNNLVRNLLYLFGANFILVGSFILGFNNLGLETDIWMLLYPFVLVLFYYLSIKLQSKVILAFTTIYTFAEVIRLTADLFGDLLGWPLALMIAGFSFITIGYLSFKLNKNYMIS